MPHRTGLASVGKEPGQIDLFDTDGYIGTIADGAIFPIAFLPDGRIVTMETDDMEIERLVIRTVDPGRD